MKLVFAALYAMAGKTGKQTSSGYTSGNDKIDLSTYSSGAQVLGGLGADDFVFSSTRTAFPYLLNDFQSMNEGNDRLDLSALFSLAETKKINSNTIGNYVRITADGKLLIDATGKSSFNVNEPWAILAGVEGEKVQIRISSFNGYLSVADGTAPVVIANQSFPYSENQVAGAIVATVAATDKVGVTQFRFAATSGSTSVDGFYQIDTSGRIVITAAGAAAGIATNDYEISPNSFTYAVQAGDAAGNWSTAVDIVLNVTDLDDIAPAAPSIAVLAASDTGASDADNISSNKTPDVVITLPTTGSLAVAGDVVKLYSGSTLVGSFTLTSTEITAGTVTITTSDLGSDGTKVLTAKITDVAGNTSSASSAINYTLDTTAPAAPSIDVLATSDTGSSSTDNISSNKTPDVVITLPTTGSLAVAGDVVKLYSGSTLVGSFTLTSTEITAGTVTITTSDLGSDGTKALTATITDVAGNTSNASSAINYTLDATAPAAPSIDVLAASDTGASDSDNISNNKTPDVVITLPTSGSLAAAGDMVKLYSGSTLVGSFTLTSTEITAGTVTITTSDLGSDGTKVLTAKITDVAGNTSSASSAINYQLDTTAPTVAGVPTLAGLAVTSNEAGTIKIGSTSVGSATTPGPNVIGEQSAVISGILTVTDQAGNVGADPSGKTQFLGSADLDSIVGDNSIGNNIWGFYQSDTLTGASGDDWISGEVGFDIIDGGSGNDFLDGGDYDDVLNGGEGNDTLDGGVNCDVMSGGGGSDVFGTNNNFGADFTSLYFVNFIDNAANGIAEVGDAYLFADLGGNHFALDVITDFTSADSLDVVNASTAPTSLIGTSIFAPLTAGTTYILYGQWVGGAFTVGASYDSLTNNDALIITCTSGESFYDHLGNQLLENLAAPIVDSQFV